MLTVKSIPFLLLFIFASADEIDYSESEQDEEYALPSQQQSTSGSAESSLLLTQILFRHGERTPVEQLPTSPYNESYWYPLGFGQLSIGGKRQAYNLGQFLRQRYGNYMGPVYVPKEIYARSTDYDRTLSTAQLVLTAFFRPKESEVWNENLSLWQPIPVHTAPYKTDFLLSTKIPCPKWDRIVNISVHSPAFKQIEEENKDLIERYLENSGYHLYYPEFWDVFDDIYSETTLGIPFPDWVNPDEFPTVEHLAYKIVEQMFVLNGVSKFKAGVLLHHMVENMMEKVKQKNEYARKMFIFAAHDMNTLSFFGTLGINLHHFSPTTACIMVELHEINERPFVKLLYRNATDVPPYRISIPRCGEVCPLRKFIRLTQPNRIADLPSACVVREED